MHDVAKYTEAEVEKLRSELILAIYYEFVYKQRDFDRWLAGFETIQKI